MKIILLGAPGAGKGTLAQSLINDFNFVQISTGDLIREVVKTDSPLATTLKQIMASGGLVDDDTVKALIENKLEQEANSGRNIIFDGFPRTLEQAKWLSNKVKIDYVVNLECDLNTIIDRLSGRRTCTVCKYITNIKTDPTAGRGICPKCGGKLVIREDDKPETITKRYNIYKKNAELLEAFYGKELITIPAYDKNVVEKEVITKLDL